MEIASKVESALRSLNKPNSLAQSPLTGTCLVAKRKAEQVELTDTEALKLVLADVNEAVSGSNGLHGDILYGRFWRKEKVETLAPRLGLGVRTLYEHQREALAEFETIFSQMEAACKATRSGSLDKYPSPKQQKVPKHRGVAALGGLVLLVAVLFAVQNRTTPFCGEKQIVSDPPNVQRFERSIGTTIFNKENTAPLLGNRVRALFSFANKILLGFFSEEGPNGMQYIERGESGWQWGNCNESGLPEGKLINSIYVDERDRIIVSTDGSGILTYENQVWTQHTETSDGSPFRTAYAIQPSPEGEIWVGSEIGVLAFENGSWILNFSEENGLASNYVHNILFDSEGNIWFGHVFSGLSRFNTQEENWQYFNIENELIPGNMVRGLKSSSSSIWVATEDAGVLEYSEGEWKNPVESNAIPFSHSRALSIDSFDRVWVGTETGTYFLEDEQWVQYHPFPTLAITFSPDCADGSCPADDHVWTGTEGHGLTHSRLPANVEALRVIEVCFVSNDSGETAGCTHPTPDSGGIIEAQYPGILRSGDKFHFLVTVMPLNDFELLGSRGDFLSFYGKDDANLYGAWPIIPVDGTVPTAQTFTFSNEGNPFVAPAVGSSSSNVFSSDWRVWSFTRYIGPTIRVVFEVAE